MNNRTNVVPDSLCEQLPASPVISRVCASYDRLLAHQDARAERCRGRDEVKTSQEMLDIATCRSCATLCFESRKDSVIQQAERDTGVVSEVYFDVVRTVNCQQARLKLKSGHRNRRICQMHAPPSG